MVLGKMPAQQGRMMGNPSAEWICRAYDAEPHLSSPLFLVLHSGLLRRIAGELTFRAMKEPSSGG